MLAPRMLVILSSLPDVSEAAQTAIFRTNGSTLFINAPSAEVYHYGVSESVDIEAVAPNSYYLNATVRSSVTIQSGRVYVTARGSVPTINAMPKAGTVAIAGDTGAQIGNIFVPANQEGVKIDSSVSSETEIGVPTQEMGLFGGGNGTQQSPFLIGTAEQFMAINELSSPSYFFKLTDNIDLTAETAEKGSFVQYFSNAVLDGAGFTVKANADLFARFDGSTLKNVTVEMNGDDLHLTGLDYTADCLFENVTLEGAVKFTGRNQGLFVVYSGIGSASKAKTLTFRGCVNNIDITGVGGESDYNAVFVGYSWGSVNLVFEDCVNNGSLTCGEAGLFLGNQANQANFVTMTIDNFVNNGTLTSTNPRDTYNQYIGRPAGASQNITVDGSKIASLKDGKWLNITQAVSDATLDIALNEDGTFEVTAATANTAQPMIRFQRLKAFLSINCSSVCLRINNGQSYENLFRKFPTLCNK